MQSYTIEIVIMPDGEIQAVVKGIKGQSCTEISMFLNDLGEVTKDDPTGEYRQSVVMKRTQELH